eukprot:5267357-Amphidinium_carterae.1
MKRNFLRLVIVFGTKDPSSRRMLVEVVHWAWHRIASCRSENVKTVYTLRMSTMNNMSLKERSTGDV